MLLVPARQGESAKEFTVKPVVWTLAAFERDHKELRRMLPDIVPPDKGKNVSAYAFVMRCRLVVGVPVVATGRFVNVASVAVSVATPVTLKPFISMLPPVARCGRSGVGQ